MLDWVQNVHLQMDITLLLKCASARGITLLLKFKRKYLPDSKYKDGIILINSNYLSISQPLK